MSSRVARKCCCPDSPRRLRVVTITPRCKNRSATATADLSSAPPTINHYNLSRSVLVQGGPAAGKSSGQALSSIQKLFESLNFNNIDYAFTGLAVAFEGFVLQNPAMIIAGTVVGSAGTLLTLMMAKAMNRQVSNIIFSDFGGEDDGSDGEIQGTMKACDASDAAISMFYANKVIIVPGYGLAVAQAQHKLYEFVKLLQKQGVEVSFAIHPVAGRMPGHMNVLLAEADVPYEQLQEMDQINPEFPATDVVLVLGANDVVNPQAKRDPNSPLYGMPVLDVQDARTVFVVKRGMSAGYSGIKNDLFELANTSMLFGDAKKVLGDLLVELKDLGLGKK